MLQFVDISTLVWYGLGLRVRASFRIQVGKVNDSAQRQYTWECLSILVLIAGNSITAVSVQCSLFTTSQSALVLRNTRKIANFAEKCCSLEQNF